MGINLVPTEISNFYNPILAEIFFSIIGLVFIATGVKAFRDTATAKHVTTGIFWTIMGVCFIIGKYIPSWIVGVLIVASAVITAIGGVVQTKNDIPTKEETRANADRIGYKIFIPALMLCWDWYPAIMQSVFQLFLARLQYLPLRKRLLRALLLKAAVCWTTWVPLPFCRSC